MELQHLIPNLRLWVTLYSQIIVGYLLTACVCRLVPNPRKTMWLWLSFLCVTAGFWLACFFPAPLTLTSAGAIAAPRVGALPLHLSLTVPENLTVHSRFISQAIGNLYLLVVGFSGLRWAYRRWQLSRLVRHGATPDKDVQEIFEELRRKLNVSNCNLRVVAGLRTPGTAFLFSPCILLPRELILRVDRKHVENAICHELMHVRNRDYLWDQIASAGFWITCMHPCAWLAYRQFQLSRELFCDLAVAGNSPARRLDYAQSLLSMARWRTSSLASGFGAVEFVSTSSPLARRVRALAAASEQKSSAQKALGAVGISAVLAAAICVIPATGFTFYVNVPRVDMVEPHPEALSIEEGLPEYQPIRSRVHKTKSAAKSAPVATIATYADVSSSGMSSIPSLMPLVSSIPTQPAQPLSVESKLAPSTATTIDTGVAARSAGTFDRVSWDEAPQRSTKDHISGWKRVAAGALVSAAARWAFAVDSDDHIEEGRQPSSPASNRPVRFR